MGSLGFSICKITSSAHRCNFTSSFSDLDALAFLAPLPWLGPPAPCRTGAVSVGLVGLSGPTGTLLFTVDRGRVTRDPLYVRLRIYGLIQAYVWGSQTMASRVWSWLVGPFRGQTGELHSSRVPRSLGLVAGPSQTRLRLRRRGTEVFLQRGPWSALGSGALEMAGGGGHRACLGTGWCVLPCTTPRGPTGTQNSTWRRSRQEEARQRQVPEEQPEEQPAALRGLSQACAWSSPAECPGSRHRARARPRGGSRSRRRVRLPAGQCRDSAHAPSVGQPGIPAPTIFSSGKGGGKGSCPVMLGAGQMGESV